MYIKVVFLISCKITILCTENIFQILSFYLQLFDRKFISSVLFLISAVVSNDNIVIAIVTRS